MNKRIEQLREIAKKHKLNLHTDTTCEGCLNPNQGASAGDDIYLGTFDNIDNLTAAFFHELAHHLVHNIFKQCNLMYIHFSFLSNEIVCWELGFSLAHKYGYSWLPGHAVFKYAYKCMSSYIDTEYDKYLKDDNE